MKTLMRTASKIEETTAISGVDTTAIGAYFQSTNYCTTTTTENNDTLRLRLRTVQYNISLHFTLLLVLWLIFRTVAVAVGGRGYIIRCAIRYISFMMLAFIGISPFVCASGLGLTVYVVYSMILKNSTVLIKQIGH
jgi:hypothetical protein